MFPDSSDPALFLESPLEYNVVDLRFRPFYGLLSRQFHPANLLDKPRGNLGAQLPADFWILYGLKEKSYMDFGPMG